MLMHFRIPVFDLLVSVTEALDLVSRGLVDHHKKVSYIAVSLASELGLSREARQDIAIAAALHDIGAISAELREASLDYEFDDHGEHAERGFRLLNRFEPLADVARIVRFHHAPWTTELAERESGQEIPLESHVLHLADRISVLLDERATILNSTERVIARIEEDSGTLFAPHIVAAFRRLAEREAFWLDAASPALSMVLKGRVAPELLELDLEGLLSLANVFRRIIDFRSRYTANHSSGVAACASKIAELVGFSERDCTLMRIAGYLHDLGKLAVPNEILEKPGKLTPEQFAQIRAHTYYTHKILEPVRDLEKVKRWASYHHERLDGTGYPFHINGRDLCLGSRIMAVADVFAAITEDRPYRVGMDEEQTLKVLNRMAGTALDPGVVTAVEQHFAVIDAARRVAQAESFDEYLQIAE